MIAPTLAETGVAGLDAAMLVMDDAFEPAFGEAWTRAQCAGVLALAGVWLTVAQVEAEPAGFALGRAVFDEAELLLLAVRPAFRRQGVAAALVARACGVATGVGASRIHLEMRAGNPAAALYRRAGFGEVGRRHGYYRGRDGQVFDAVSLSLPLPSATRGEG